MKLPVRIGIDLGGSKIEGIIIDDVGHTLSKQRIKTPVGQYVQTIIAIADLVASLCTEASIDDNIPVGVGIPGKLLPDTGLIKNANSTWLIGKPLKKDLESALARNVRTENDANCFAISEAIDGAGKNYKVIFGVILGTGVGGGLAIDGKAWTGKNLISGEWGHNPLPLPVTSSELLGAYGQDFYPDCYCGKIGCIETFLSGPGLARDHGTGASAEQINRMAMEGNQQANFSLRRYESRLARALGSVINILDPDAIILGGGLSNIASLYHYVPNIWNEWIFSDKCSTPLLKNMHGDSSGVRGAAWLW